MIRFIFSFLGAIFSLVTNGLVMGALIAGGVIFSFTRDLPAYQTLQQYSPAPIRRIYNRDGEIMDEFAAERRIYASYDEIPEVVVHAFVSAEDRNFFEHSGYDPRAIGAAVVEAIRSRGQDVRGASTITQQVAKRVYFSDLPGLQRKLKEVPMSIAMELKYSKNDILTIYLNRAYLGAGTFGFEAASERYFGKSARTVNPAEAAMLAGLLKAPSTYAPTRDLGRAQDRANLIIGLMEDQGYLTADEARNARANPARLSKTAEKRAGGYFADWIMESAPDFLIKDTTEATFMADVVEASQDVPVSLISGHRGADPAR